MEAMQELVTVARVCNPCVTLAGLGLNRRILEAFQTACLEQNYRRFSRPEDWLLSSLPDFPLSLTIPGSLRAGAVLPVSPRSIFLFGAQLSFALGSVAARLPTQRTKRPS